MDAGGVGLHTGDQSWMTGNPEVTVLIRRGNKEIYSVQAIARNGQNLYHLAEAVSIAEALEKLVQEMRLQDKNSASFHTLAGQSSRS